MVFTRYTSIWLGTLICFQVPQSTFAQQVHVATPAHQFGDSFFENYGVGWGFRQQSRNGAMFLRIGNNAGAPSGRFDPTPQSSFGFGGRSGNTSWGFNIFGSQGSNRSYVSTTPSLVVPHGGFGFIQDVTVRPFVTGLVPVVGSQVVSPLEERLYRMRFNDAVKTTQQRSAARRELEAREMRDAVERSERRAKQPRQDDPPLVLRGGAKAKEKPGQEKPGPGSARF